MGWVRVGGSTLLPPYDHERPSSRATVRSEVSASTGGGTAASENKPKGTFREKPQKFSLKNRDGNQNQASVAAASWRQNSVAANESSSMAGLVPPTGGAATAVMAMASTCSEGGWYLTGTKGVLQQSYTEAYLWARKAA